MSSPQGETKNEQTKPVCLPAEGSSIAETLCLGFLRKEKPMQYKIFTYPLGSAGTQIDELNRFLAGHKVVEVEKHLVVLDNAACWSFCVCYLQGEVTPPAGEKREKIDYKTLLSEEEFAVFSKLRAIRKKLSEEDAVPAFAVFTDAELAEMAKFKDLSAKQMQSIQGIGSKRMERYGMPLLERYQQQQALETSGELNP